jgi:type II restriction enzyme
MPKQFSTFLSQLSKTNATLDYFTDFNKIDNNIKKIEIKLSQLNYLLGKQDLKKAIDELYKENPTVFEVLGILIAVRDCNQTKTLNNQGQSVLLANYFSSPDLIFEYIEESGLAEIFRNKTVTNLVDYAFGIEVGLDTNARKNRGGSNMSKAISLVFDNANFFYKTEVNSTEFNEIQSLGVDVKRFDFVIKTQNKTYLIEVNYYNTGGSKLNEIARSYSELALKINQYHDFEFVWITDGKGWLKAKKMLEEAFNIIPSLYNFVTLKEFIDKLQSETVVKF